MDSVTKIYFQNKGLTVKSTFVTEADILEKLLKRDFVLLRILATFYKLYNFFSEIV